MTRKKSESGYLILSVPISVRTRADEFLRQADGEKQTALEFALLYEDQVADSGYSFAVVVRELCQSRAQADYEGGHVLIEVIENRSSCPEDSCPPPLPAHPPD